MFSSWSCSFRAWIPIGRSSAHSASMRLRMSRTPDEAHQLSAPIGEDLGEALEPADRAIGAHDPILDAMPSGAGENLVELGADPLAILRVDLMAVALGVGRSVPGHSREAAPRGRPQDPTTRDWPSEMLPIEGPHLAGFQRERESFLALSDCRLGQPVRSDIALEPRTEQSPSPRCPPDSEEVALPTSRLRPCDSASVSDSRFE